MKKFTKICKSQKRAGVLILRKIQIIYCRLIQELKAPPASRLFISSALKPISFSTSAL